MACGQAQNEAQIIQEQEPQHQQQAQPLPLPFPIEIVEGEDVVNTRLRREAASEQREIDDLAAQQGMNAATQEIITATKKLRDYAFYSTAFVGIGTALLLVTLWLLGKQTELLKPPLK